VPFDLGPALVFDVLANLLLEPEQSDEQTFICALATRSHPLNQLLNYCGPRSTRSFHFQPVSEVVDFRILLPIFWNQVKPHRNVEI
jgi:hypothetical protein